MWGALSEGHRRYLLSPMPNFPSFSLFTVCKATAWVNGSSVSVIFNVTSLSMSLSFIENGDREVV